MLSTGMVLVEHISVLTYPEAGSGGSRTLERSITRESSRRSLQLRVFLSEVLSNLWARVRYPESLGSVAECSSMSHGAGHVLLFVTGCQAPLSMGFSRQEYWSGLPFPPPGSPASPESQADSLPLCHLESPLMVQAYLEFSILFFWPHLASRRILVL